MAIPYPMPTTMAPQGAYLGSPDILGRLKAGLAGNSNALLGYGLSILSGNPQAAAAAFAAGSARDDAYATSQKAEAQRQQQLNQTVEYLRKAAPQYAEAVQAGVLSPSDAYRQFLADQKGAGPQAPIELSPGATLYDPNTNKPLFTAPKESTPSSGIQEYQFAVSQGYKGTFADYKREMAKAGATSIDLNANQGAAAAYADRMATSNSILDDPKMVEAMTSVDQTVRSGTPMVGNFLTSKERQQAEQAQRDFVNAVLRRESGAVISPAEFDNAKQQYFPQPGDTKEVIAQKAQNRKIAIAAIARQAGANYTLPTLTPGASDGSVVDYRTYFGGQ